MLNVFFYSLDIFKLLMLSNQCTTPHVSVTYDTIVCTEDHMTGGVASLVKLQTLPYKQEVYALYQHVAKITSLA